MTNIISESTNEQLNLELINERLSLQVSSFQEGFRILSKSKSFEELVNKFCHILRGNLLTAKVRMYFLESNTEKWLGVYNPDKSEMPNIDNLQNSKYSVLYPGIEDSQAVVNLPLFDGSVFRIFMGQKLNKFEYTPLDRISIQIFTQLFDNAYQAFINQKREKDLIFSLNHRLLQLNSLIDTGIEISKVHKNRDLLELGLMRAVSLTNASKGFILVRKENKLVDEFYFPGRMEPDCLNENKSCIKSEFEFLEINYEIRLFEKESRQGTIDFDETDELLLGAIARQINSAIENEFLLKEALDKERIQQELSVAATIQRQILPTKLPDIPGYDIAGINIPSKEVGGDYYDCMKLPDGRYALIMADVAGKGVPASLLVSTLNASLTSYLDFPVDLPDLAIKLNKIIYNASTQDKFITFFMAILTPETGELEILNAGHNPSLLLRNDKSLYKIEAGGVAFGMFNMGLPFASEKLTINTGEQLLLFTDGIPEAMNEEEVEYSDETLEEFFIKNHTDSSQHFINHLVEDVKNFTGDAEQSDDITTLFIIRKTKEEN